jgi:hypothetical protein
MKRKLTVYEKALKQDKLKNKISVMLIEGKFENWNIETNDNLNNISGFNIEIFPSSARYLSEVKKIVFTEDVSGTIERIYTR